MIFRRTSLAATAILLLSQIIAGCLFGGVSTVSAAPAFADPAFQTQWQAGEAITPNFWGPLDNATPGLQEAYKESQGGQRLVQYFDKGRMELTNGAVTNGLLASEIMKGQIQVGDGTFQDRPRPTVSIAGDSDNPGPTYAGIATKGAQLLAPASSQIGANVSIGVSADGTTSQGESTTTPGPTAITTFDDTTKHNVPAAFADYRSKAGLATIGLAISEPFRASVKVAGAQKDVVIQIFERRVLTYTASNPDAFKVEMGNIGLHYSAWRYITSNLAPLPAGMSRTLSIGPPASVQKTGPLAVNISLISASVPHGGPAFAAAETTVGGSCSIAGTYQSGSAFIPAAGPRTVDDKGGTGWFWIVGADVAPGPGTIIVTCTANGLTGSASTQITVTP